MFKGILISMRPAHWVKNLIVFAALIFAQVYMMPGKVWLAVLAFVAFCLATSSVYLVNDIFDRESDGHKSDKNSGNKNGHMGSSFFGVNFREYLR